MKAGKDSTAESLAMDEKADLYRQIVEYSFEPTIIHSDHKVLYINQAGSDFFGAEADSIKGSSVVNVFTEEYQGFIEERIRRGTEEGVVGELVETRVRLADGSVADVELYCHPVQFGDTKAIQSIIRDITGHKQAERELTELKNEIATPIVPIVDGVAVLPLVGAVGGDRATQLLDIIPQKIQGQDLEHLIIDVSGIYNIDSVVAEFLYKINAILELLGIELIFTGIRPELAQKAVEARMDFTKLRTMSNVKEALKQVI